MTRLSELCDIITSTRLETLLRGGAWTIFAPLNKAFWELPTDLVQRDTVQFADGVEKVEDILLFHAIEGILNKDVLPCAAGQNLLSSAIGKNSRTLCDNDVPKYQKGQGNTDNALPEIVEFDITACNGVIHIVDKVLLFDTMADTGFTLSRGS